MNDITENIRREQVAEINGVVQSDDEVTERKRLESQHGQIWDTGELTKDFSVLGFMAPYVVVQRLSDNKKGSLQFQHWPRFYFNFIEDNA